MRYAVTALVLLCVVGRANGQNIADERKNTQQRLEALKGQIESDEKRLQETTREEQATVDRLEQIRREIALREELVSTYEQRMGQLRQERSDLRDTLDVLEGQLDELRNEYRAHAVHAYKYGRLHDVALILASKSVSQMLVRVRYLRRFAEQRRAQQSAIQSAAQQFNERQRELDASQRKTERLLAEARQERQNLSQLQKDRRQVVAELRNQRSELREEIDRKERAARELEQQIRELVARAEARERRDRVSGATSAPARAADYARLSATFQQNRGSLPWPTDGAVTEGFGNRVDPVHGTETYHPGILIATNPEESVRAVFEGVVTGIDFVPGYGTYLVIRHGDYLSVYSNFSTLFVAQGDRVDTGEVIGRSGTSNEPRGAGLFFAVFDKKKNQSVDPVGWLGNR
ncbi:murein hydrolase activator EnvC family protein [Longibacter salinarum]|nr:peptidoglycan DD-metalloendopeptidase family protein [Longibacter salinarum]